MNGVIQFAANAAMIQSDSKPLIKKLAEELLAHPEITKIEIAGMAAILLACTKLMQGIPTVVASRQRGRLPTG